METGEEKTEKTGSVSAAQRRAEIRRRKLLMNSEDRMNRIVGFSKSDSENNGRHKSFRKHPQTMLGCIIYNETCSIKRYCCPHVHSV